MPRTDGAVPPFWPWTEDGFAWGLLDCWSVEVDWITGVEVKSEWCGLVSRLLIPGTTTPDRASNIRTKSAVRLSSSIFKIFFLLSVFTRLITPLIGALGNGCVSENYLGIFQNW